MKEFACKILELIEKEYELYSDIYFSEMDKGIMVFFHLEGNQEVINHDEQHNLNCLQEMVNKKEKLIKQLRKEMDMDKAALSELYQKLDHEYNEGFYERFAKLRENFAILLNATSDVNSKNMILLNTSAMVVKKIFENMSGRTETYDTKGNVGNMYSGRVIAQI